MKNKLSLFTLIGLLLGIILGLVLPQYAPYIKFIGTYYITILKYMVVPVVVTTISVSIYNSSKLKSKMVPLTLLVFVLMFSATFLLSSLIVTIINPSSGFILNTIDWSGSTSDLGIKGMLLNLIPKDISKFLTGGYLFTVILIAALIGKLCSIVSKGDKVINVIEKIKDFLFKVLNIYMYVTPFAVLSLISNTIVEYGPIILGLGAKYILTAYICAIFALIFVMILPILLITKMSPVTFVKKVYKIWMITLSTCSSAATLPYTIKTCHDEFNIPDEVTDVVVPLGTTIHMCGGAVSFALLGLFCSKLFNVEITFSKYLLMLIYAILINMAAPGIPNGGVAIGATYLQLLGIPLDFIGFYSGIYKLLDMIYTSLNVTDDIASNVIINYFHRKKENK
ncbi:MAG: dicarboxylate/amino acid:cation symporter [Erysipelotrichaceae bacterium]|nr:dicarboxylate/amino acid:cation symporter [Erysipelotrichaceae bacterium]